jgi:hypothetical protein
MVQTKFCYSNPKSDVVVDLMFGPNAELGNFGKTTGGLNSYRPVAPYSTALRRPFKQAYFTYRATAKLSFTVGQFVPRIGYEVINVPLNYHYWLNAAYGRYDFRPGNAAQETLYALHR